MSGCGADEADDLHGRGPDFRILVAREYGETFDRGWSDVEQRHVGDVTGEPSADGGGDEGFDRLDGAEAAEAPGRRSADVALRIVEQADKRRSNTERPDIAERERRARTLPREVAPAAGELARRAGRSTPSSATMRSRDAPVS